MSTLVSTLRNLLNLHLADPKVDDFPFSIQSAILYALLQFMLCFRSSMLVRSLTVNNISGTRHQSLLHAIRNLFVFVEYCHLLELYVNVLPSIGHSFHSRSGIRDVVVREGDPSPSDPVAGRVRVMVVGQGSYRQKTWSYKRDGRW